MTRMPGMEYNGTSKQDESNRRCCPAGFFTQQVIDRGDAFLKNTRQDDILTLCHHS